LSSEPVIAAKAPIPVEVEAGKTYYWCSCGRSQNQPFCDGAHSREGTDLTPLKWEAPESKTAYFCACKQTANAPLCDGSHAKL
jgi:CDGSH-type Zn-finger protein